MFINRFKRTEDLESLYSVVNRFLDSSGTDEIIEDLLQVFVEVSRGITGTLHIINHAHNKLIYVYGYRQSKLARNINIGSEYLGEYIEEIIKEQKNVRLSDDLNYQKFIGKFGVKYAKVNNTPLFSLPLLEDGHVLGAITVEQSTQRAYSSEELNDLLTIIRFIGLVYRKSSVTHIPMMRSLERITDSSSVLEKETLCNLIVEEIKLVTDADVVTMYITDPISGSLSNPPFHTELRHPDEISKPKPIVTGFMYELLSREKPYIVEDIDEDQFFSDRSFPEREKLRSYIAFPMDFLGKRLGLIFVCYGNIKTFNQHKIDWMSFFVGHCTRMIALYNSLSAKRQTAISQRVSNPLSQDERIQTTLDYIGTLACEIITNSLQSDSEDNFYCYVALIEDEMFRFISAQPKNILHEIKRAFGNISASDGISGEVVKTGNYVNIPDVDRNTFYKAIFEDVSSQLTVPIIADNKVIGIISAEGTAKNAFNERHENDYLLLAELASIAIENARLFDDIVLNRDRLLKAWETAKALTSIKISNQYDITLQSISDTALEAFDCDVVTLYTYDQVSDTITNTPKVSGNLIDPDKVLRGKDLPPKSVVRFFLEVAGPYFAREVSHDVILNETRFARTEKIHSCIALPLRLGNIPVGVMFLNFRQERLDIDDDTRIIMQWLSNQAAMLIHHSHLHVHVSSRANTLQIINTISTKIVDAGSIEGIVNLILQGSQNLTNAAFGVIYLVKTSNNNNYHIDTNRVFMTDDRPNHPLPRLDDPESSLTSWILKKQTHVFIQDIRTPGNYKPNSKLVEHGFLGLVGIPMIPLKQQSTVIGILFLFFSDIRSLTDEEISNLSILAGQAATIIHMKQSENELKSSQRITQRILSRLRKLRLVTDRLYSSKSQKIILEDILLQELVSAFDLDYGAISIANYNESTISTEYALSNRMNISVEWISLSQYSLDAQDIIAYVCKTNQPVIINHWDIDKWQDRLNQTIFEKFDHRNLNRAYIPIRGSKDPIGVLEVGYHKDNAVIKKHDVFDLGLFLDQAALVLLSLENEKNIDRLKRTGNELEVKNLQLESFRNIVENSVGDLEEPSNVFQQIADRIRVALDAEIVVIMPFDGKNYIKDWRVVSPSIVEHVVGDPELDGVTVEIFEKGMILVKDVQNYSGNPKILSPFVVQNKISSFIGMRMRYANENTGVIFVNYQHEFSNHDVAILEKIADYIAGLVRTAIDINDLKTIVNLDDAIYQLDNEESVWKQLLKDIQELIPNDQCIVWIYDSPDDPEMLIPNIIEGKYKDEIYVHEMSLEIGEGLAGLVAKTEQPMVFNNVAQNYSEQAVLIPGSLEKEKQNMLCSPFFIQGELAGVISVSRYHLGEFDEKREPALMQIIAERASAAIQIVRAQTELNSETKRHAETLRSLIEERGDRFAGKLFYNIVAHDIKNLVTEINFLLDDLQDLKISGRVRRNINNVSNNISNSIEAIKSFIEITKQVSPERSFHDVNDLIKYATDLMRLRFEQRDINVFLSLDNTLPEIEISYIQILEVILNLLSNAIKAMKTVSNRDLHIETKSAKNGTVIEIRVSDSGIGIRNEHTSMILNEVHSWWPESNGSGIGLNISNSIISQHGGEMRFDTRVGKGTTFIIHLPIV